MQSAKSAEFIVCAECRVLSAECRVCRVLSAESAESAECMLRECARENPRRVLSLVACLGNITLQRAMQI